MRGVEGMKKNIFVSIFVFLIMCMGVCNAQDLGGNWESENCIYITNTIDNMGTPVFALDVTTVKQEIFIHNSKSYTIKLSAIVYDRTGQIDGNKKELMEIWIFPYEKKVYYYITPVSKGTKDVLKNAILFYDNGRFSHHSLCNATIIMYQIAFKK